MSVAFVDAGYIPMPGEEFTPKGVIMGVGDEYSLYPIWFMGDERNLKTFVWISFDGDIMKVFPIRLDMGEFDIDQEAVVWLYQDGHVEPIGSDPTLMNGEFLSTLYEEWFNIKERLEGNGKA